VTAGSGRVFGIVGALSAFPRRLAAREVARRGGVLRRGVGRGTTHVVFGRTLLDRWDQSAIAARAAAERAAGRVLLGEAGFLHSLGLVEAPEATGGMTQTSLLDQSRLAPDDLELLTLFDAFEHTGEPYSFRDLILARKYAGLRAGGAGWAAVARSVHRFGPVTSLTAKSLHVERGRSIYLRTGDSLTEIDGQLLFDLGGDREDPEDLFSAAEAAEAAGRSDEAVGLYRRCLDLDPGDAVAAFNLGNCQRGLGRSDQAAAEYLRAAKLDPGFVEAWFNLGCLGVAAGRSDSARRHLHRALTLDPAYADAVYNLASLEFDAGNLAEARRLWSRYLELDPGSAWARKAARGMRYVDLHAALGSTG